MSAWIAGTAGVMAGASLASGIMGAKGAAKEADRRREAEMDAAKLKYNAIESNTNYQKNRAREETQNAQREVARAGAENNRELKGAIQKSASTLQSQSEGLTSGRSKGREMMDLQMKGTQAIYDSKSEASDMLSKLVSDQDNKTNELNTKLLSAHAEMSSVLSTPGQTFQQNTGVLIANTVGGAASGASLGIGLDKKFG